jgi:hypothetical protein
MDLELVETNDLVEELFKRFDHVIFAGMKGHTIDKQKVAARSYGNPFACSGLCQMVSQECVRKWVATSSSSPTTDL